MANYSEVEEELLAEQQEEEERARALEEQKQIDRLEQEQNNPANQLREAAFNAAKSYAKSAAKNIVKEEAVAAASAAGSAIASTAPIWGPILGIILAIGALIFIVVITIYAGCNQSGLSGWGAQFLSKISGGLNSLGFNAFPPDVCAMFNGGESGGAGASGTYTASNKITIVLTSAYRPGAIVKGTNRLSAHGRGEAVDIALRNPTVPEGSSDPRIAQLVKIGMAEGFVPPPGDTLDEYTNPTEGASGGHIHLEFNLKPDGTTYCDNTKVSNPPTDLVKIPTSIPMEGVSNSYLRQCMLDKVIDIFNTVNGPATTP